MKKVVFCLSLFISQAVLATTFTTYGNTTYANDGTRYTTYGNTTYGSDGSRFTQYGNTTYATAGYGSPNYGSSNIVQPTYFSDEPSRQMMRVGQAISEMSSAILQMGIEESRANSYEKPSTRYVDYSEVINTAYYGDSAKYQQTGNMADDRIIFRPTSNTPSKSDETLSPPNYSGNQKSSQLFDNMTYTSGGRTCRKTGGKSYCD